MIASIGFALVWLVRVPPFQQPDEDVHADYALSIYSTHGLIRAGAGSRALDVHPLVPYLKNATGFRSMLYNLDGRVPADYGTTAFDRPLDAGAPRASRNFIDRSKRIPYISLFYPYLYYAADAATIGIASAATGQTGISLLFFARGFSIFLLACSLLLTYGVLRMTGLPLGLRLLAIAAIGLFPLTSWVSAYVQPDNLAFAAVSLALYLTLRITGGIGGRTAPLFLGVALGILWLTKVQYFVATAVPVLASLTACALTRRRPAIRQTIVVVTLSAVPLVIAIGSQRVLGTDSIGTTKAFYGSYGQSWTQAAATAPNAVAFVLHSVLDAYVSVFVRGRAFLSYWDTFGYFPFPITFGTPALTHALDAAIGGLSLLVAILMVVREARVLARLYRIGARGRIRSALRLLTSAVALNTYLTFCLVMLTIYVVSGGHLANWGRSWMPLQAGAVLCAVWYAPQALPRAIGMAFRRVLAASLLAYSCVGAVAGVLAINERFYAPPNPPGTSEALAGIDAFDERSGPAGRTIVVHGFALDSRAGLPAKRVDLLVDGSQRIPTQYGSPRPDISERVHDPAILDSGFVGRIDTGTLQPGPHSVSLLVYERSRSAPYPSENSHDFALPLQPTNSP